MHQYPVTILDSSQFHCLLSFSVSFCFVGEISLFRGLSWFIPGVSEGYCMMLGAHLFGLPKVSQAYWSWQPAAGSQVGGGGSVEVVATVLSVYCGIEKTSTG
jgi:hypothetical protein